MGKDIEVTSISNPYKNLFETGERLNEMNKKNVEAILYELCDGERDHKLLLKTNAVKSRTISQDESNKTNTDKVLNYDRTFSLIANGISVGFHVVGAFAGGSTAGICQGLGQGLTSMADYRNKNLDAQLEGLSHRYQGVGSRVGEMSQDIQHADREFDQIITTIERVKQSGQRTAELVLSSS